MALLVRKSPALPWLLDARVQRVDSPFPGCLSLSLFQPAGKRVLVLLFGPHARGVGSVPERPKGLAASPFVQRLRSAIAGSRLSAAEWLSPLSVEPVSSERELAHALLLTFRRGELHERLVLDFDHQAPNLFLLRDDDTVAGAADEGQRKLRFAERSASYLVGSGRGVAWIDSDDELRRQGELLLEHTKQRGHDALRARLEAQARASLKKVERKAAAIRGDLARVEAAPRLRREAHALLCHLHEIPRGATTIRLIDPSSEPAEELLIELDPTRDAQQNAQQRFERAKKLERGISIATARLAEAEAEVTRLRERLADLSQGTVTELELAPGAFKAAAPARRNKPPTRVSYRLFLSSGGARILVGKGAADNDTLTLTVARPHDHWLHVRGVAGSHVVVPLEKSAAIGQELLLDASHLAAHFSKVRGEPLVEIAHTPRRFVRKPKGAAPGSVNVDRERVFVLRVDAERLARLLASERT